MRSAAGISNEYVSSFACIVLIYPSRSHKSAIERYDQEMKRSEAQRESMREKLSNLRSRCEELEAELHSMRSEGAKHGSRDIEAQCESLRKENRDLKSQIESIAVENAVKTNSAVSRAIDQLNASFAETAKQIEKAAQDSAKKLYESKKATELLAMQSNCNNQIETVKAELQAKAAKDLEEQRKTFEAREAQTMLDLQQLEGLHQHRVSELETLVRTLRARCETAEEALSAAAVSRVKMSVASRDITNERIKQLEAYAETAESLQAALHSKNEELLGVRSKEVSYMEQLRRVTEENSVLRAQNQATLRQAAQDASDAMESRRSKHDLELRVASMSSSLAIAREETFLLENEVNRLKALNSHLQDALDRADNVIYGNGVLSVNNHKKGTVLSFKSPAASLNQRSFGKTKITVAPSDHDMHQRHQHPEVSQASSSRREMTSPAPRSKAPSPAATQSTPQRRSRAAPK
jgi:chromosome segregation ATPase